MVLVLLTATVGSAAPSRSAAAAPYGPDATAPSASPSSAPSEGASDSAPTFADVPYADISPAQALDLWLPDSVPGPWPLVILIHGGGFKAGDKASQIARVRTVLEAGYAAASIDYRLSGEARFPAAVQDAKAAVRSLRANAATYGLDAERFAVWGVSAGANLALMIGVSGDQLTDLDDPALGHVGVSSAVSAVVAWYPPVDFLVMAEQARRSYPKRCKGSPPDTDAADSNASRYLGAPVQAVPEVAAAANPISYLATATQLPAFSLAVGSADCVVPSAQSRVLDAALRSAGARSSLIVVPGAAHGDRRVARLATPAALAMLADTFGR
jgi:acetyl esterase/lipase